MKQGVRALTGRGETVAFHTYTVRKGQNVASGDGRVLSDE